MFKNYFKVALRNIVKHSFYSTINLLGLAAGVTCCLFVILYVADELSYDKFHYDAENIYSIGLHGKIAGQEIFTASSCPPLHQAMVDEIPGIEQATRISRRDNMVFKQEEKIFTENRIIFADSNFFQFFSFKLVEGDPVTALKAPNSVVLSEELAQKYFNGDALGKLMTIGNDNETYKVTGIAENTPHNSHFLYNALISTSSDKPQFENGIWLNNSLYTYVRKNPQTTVESVNNKLQEMVAKYTAPQIEQFIGVSFDKFLEQGNIYSYLLYPTLDTHLYSEWNDTIEANSDITYVYIFSAVGLFILVIACINFMNLSTARSSGRAKEVGLRKTLGSYREQMVAQFLAESTIYGMVAITIAVGLTYLLLPQFNLLAGKQLAFASLVSPTFFAGVIGLVLVIGLLAGSYPAFYMTSFSAVEVLKGKVRAGLKSKGVRSGLVVFQFSLSIILIIATTVVYQQIEFLQSRNMGLDKQNVIALRNTRNLKTNQQAFKNTLLDFPEIENASYTNNVFPGINNTTAFRSASDQKDHIMGRYVADFDHSATLKFEIAEGRFFSREFPSDSMAVVVNEAAVRELGWANPLEEELIDYNGNDQVTMKVIGVVKDFNFESYKTKVRPLVIILTNSANNLLIRYSGDPSAAVKNVEELWKKYASGQPFEYVFLDQNFDQLFREEQRLSTLFSIFTGLAIFIACLGLFALAAFTAEQRTKEIGIRKALGATVFNITKLLSREFTILVIIAFVLAIAPSYYLLNNWLDQFAYKVEISALVFVVSGVGALLIAWLTVVFQALKAGMAKPINSLRYE
ncbi:MAG: ABC transporter permease [Cyclobacteriaceae bacterium]